MSSRTLNIHEAKTRLSAVLMEIEKTGESYVICRNGKPVAMPSPFKGFKGDRLIIATTLIKDLPAVTADRRFAEYGVKVLN